MTDLKKTIQQIHQSSYRENLSKSPQELKMEYPQYLSKFQDENELISLPDISAFIPEDNNFLSLLKKRRSVRRYNTQDLMSLQELSYLLTYTQGVREIDEKRNLTTRFVPSAGSRHPFETYLLIQRVESLTPGIYHYIAQNHALEPFSFDYELIDSAYEGVYKQKQVITSAVTFFWAADLYRTSWRYSERAYRYATLDAGHICQNLYLAAESIGYGVCAIASFDDHEINRLLGQDEIDQFVSYIASVGKKVD